MKQTAPPVESTVIDRLVDGVYPAMALLGALKLDLFSALTGGPLTADQVAKIAGTDPEGTARLLTALVAAELLVREEDRFDLTPEAAVYLVADSPWSRTAGADLLQLFWGSCLETSAVVSGERQVARGARCCKSEGFLRAIDPDARSIAQLVAELFSFPKTGVLLDVGGGAGGAALTFAEMFPQLECRVVELPKVAPLSRRLLDEAGGADIAVDEQDVVATTVGQDADVVWAQFLTQTMAPDDAKRAVNNMVRALRPGGMIHLVNIVTDGTTRTRRADSFDLVLLNLYESGQVHSTETIEHWLEDAGAVGIGTRAINDMVSITSARTPKGLLM